MSYEGVTEDAIGHLGVAVPPRAVEPLAQALPQQIEQR
jgi:hypothetical protein